MIEDEEAEADLIEFQVLFYASSEDRVLSSTEEVLCCVGFLQPLHPSFSLTKTNAPDQTTGLARPPNASQNKVHLKQLYIISQKVNWKAKL